MVGITESLPRIPAFLSPDVRPLLSLSFLLRRAHLIHVLRTRAKYAEVSLDILITSRTPVEPTHLPSYYRQATERAPRQRVFSAPRTLLSSNHTTRCGLLRFCVADRTFPFLYRPPTQSQNKFPHLASFSLLRTTVTRITHHASRIISFGSAINVHAVSLLLLFFSFLAQNGKCVGSLCVPGRAAFLPRLISWFLSFERPKHQKTMLKAPNPPHGSESRSESPWQPELRPTATESAVYFVQLKYFYPPQPLLSLSIFFPSSSR